MRGLVLEDPPSPRRPLSPKECPKATPPGAQPRLAPAQRPATAAALRSLVQARLAQKLAKDASIYAIHPGDAASLGSLVQEVAELNAEARAKKTRAKDQWGYQWWCKACDAINTPAIRPTDHLFEEREAVVASHPRRDFRPLRPPQK